jgi:hypothetical protein
MVGGDTSVDNTVTSYIKGQEILLSTTGTVASHVWAQAIPSGSAPARSALSSSTSAAPKFTPDVAGYYTVTCNADGTNYVLRIQVLEPTTATFRNAIQLPLLTSAQVPTPPVGSVNVYCEGDALKFKDSDGTVHTVTDT